MISERVLKLGDNNFSQIINEVNTPFLVDFWASWCGPCRMIAPVLEEIASEFSEKITVGKINVDECPNTPADLNVSSIPTLIVFKEGQEVSRSVGYKTKDQLNRWLVEYL